MPRDQFQGKAENLEVLAKAHFKRKFSKAERNLLASAPLGQVAHCGPTTDPTDRDNDPSKAEKRAGHLGWGPDREIAADLIRWLCVDRRAKEQVDPWGVRIQAAKITGPLVLAFVVSPFPIRLWNCVLTNDAWLLGIEIPELNFGGSWTKSLGVGAAIVRGDVFLRGLHADGEVDLSGAQIGGNLECDNSCFNNPRDVALHADGISVKGSIFLRGDRFNATGEVRLPGCSIGGALDCGGGSFDDPDALHAAYAEVKGPVSLNKCGVRGEVNLVAAQIGGNLDCTGGTFSNPKGWALIAEHVRVKGDLILAAGFRPRGEVDLIGASIDGSLYCIKGSFKQASLYLTDASAAGIFDRPNNWPEPGNLHLDGFVYERIINSQPEEAETRLKWLALQPERPFATQPYLQLAKVLKDAGDDDGAQRVLEETERLRRRQNDRTRARRAWSELLDWSIRFGYEPERAVLDLGILAGIGWILYRRSYLAGSIVPAEKDACRDFKYDGQTPTNYEAFSPLVYSVENSLPLVRLGQADKWRPDPDPSGSLSRKVKWIKSASREKCWALGYRWLERLLIFLGLLAPVHPQKPPSPFSRLGTSPRFLRWFLWAQILLGWLLATLFLAGITGIVRK